jgi:membrane-associated phospholipid phosphatase
MLWWGMAGENESETAWTAIKSATLTVGAETVGKVAINRARPEAGLGAAHFDPFGKGSANSSFPSVHMGTAFALVTPFAQDYNAPWLYAIAGATAFGRIQQRQHFASDIAAGSLMGYATGTLLLDQQHRNRKAPRIEIGSNRSIKSTWEF